MRIASDSNCDRSRRQRRSGIVQIEFAFFFPMFVVFIAILFLILSASMTRSRTAIQARYRSFEQRYDQTRVEAGDGMQQLNTPRPKHLERPLSRASQNQKDVVVSEKSATADSVFSIFDGVLSEAVVTSQVLSNSWDFNELAFERHPQLTISQRSIPFGVATNAINAFEVLKVSGQSTHGVDVSGQVAAQKNSASRLSQGIADAEQRLKAARAEPQPDQIEIDRIRIEIDLLEEAKQYLQHSNPSAGG